jgi:YD repeat-containing protein
VVLPIAPKQALAQEVSEYSYDASGRLTASSRSRAQNGVTSTYTYDAAGNRALVKVDVANQASTCSFAIHDNEGNDEFTLELDVVKTGTCSGVVEISYTTDYHKNPSGIIVFGTSELIKGIAIPADCCGVGTVTRYNVSISILSGSASITDGNAVATIFGNG